MLPSGFSLTTKELCQALRISDSTLRRIRHEGVLKPGIHFRAVGFGTKRPVLLWDAAATDATLAERSSNVLHH